MRIATFSPSQRIPVVLNSLLAYLLYFSIVCNVHYLKELGGSILMLQELLVLQPLNSEKEQSNTSTYFECQIIRECCPPEATVRG